MDMCRASKVGSCYVLFVFRFENACLLIMGENYTERAQGASFSSHASRETVVDAGTCV